MKTKIKLISLLLMLSICVLMTPKKASAQWPVSFQIFYDELSPYGNWVQDANYGYVWVPNVEQGFTPYASNGYWVYTDEGWTWVSYYAWGWAPFHYGRWIFDILYGPMWIPDYQWGPGWVNWRYSDDYYGWAPMGPYGYGYNVPYHQWTFVNCRDFGRSDITNYYINNTKNVTIINKTTVINKTRVSSTGNVTYNAGPEKADVEKHLGKLIAPVTVNEGNDKPRQNLSNNTMKIYKPQVQKNTATEMKPAPAKVTNLKDVKTIQQRTAATPVKKPNQVPVKTPVKPQQNQPKKGVEQKH
ncbi:MAG: DUF6600 domain-containing protein [Bacteroidales bacterium]|jgi:hypothetical protein